jgi:hypothetical protein
MFKLEGRIYDINVISDKKAQVILKRTYRGKPILSVYEAFGFVKEKMDALKLQKNERVEGRWYSKANLWKGKWYPDNCITEIERYVKKPKFNPMQNQQAMNSTKEENLFDINEDVIGDNHIIDEDTGEILL